MLLSQKKIKKIFLRNSLITKNLENILKIFLKRREGFWPFLPLSNGKTNSVNKATGLNSVKITGLVKK